MEKTAYLEKFKNLEISKRELVDAVGINVFKEKRKEFVEVSKTDLVKTLEALQFGKVSFEEFMDWVDTVWYTPVFDFKAEERDVIFDVMGELEEIDIDINKVSDANIKKYMKILKSV